MAKPNAEVPESVFQDYVNYRQSVEYHEDGEIKQTTRSSTYNAVHTASTGASDQLNYVWDSSKGKSTGSAIISRRAHITTSYGMCPEEVKYGMGWTPTKH